MTNYEASVFVDGDSIRLEPFTPGAVTEVV